MISLILTHLLGLYLALLCGFNKGFAYTFFWVGPVPLFISELVLLSMSLVFAIAALRRKLHFEKSDVWVYVPLAIFWLAGLIGIWPAMDQAGTDVMDALKRSALCYYSLFAFLSYTLVRDRDSIKRLLFWMFLGGLICMVPNLLMEIPGWTRYVQVGIAAVTSIAFASIYSFFRFDDGVRSKVYPLICAVTSIFVLFTTIRSAFIALIISSGLVVILLLACDVPKQFWKHALKCAVSTLIVASASIAIWGALPGVGRFQHLLFPVNSSEAAALVEKPPQTSAPVTPVQEPGLNSAPVGFFRKKWLKIDVYFLKRSEGGNASWRLRVWKDGIQQVTEKNLFFGVGFAESFIVRSMIPFKDPSRYAAALSGMKKTYEFKGRISSPSRSPSDDVVPKPPFKLTAEEQTMVVSDHWYGIDFHNSHVAIFFRMGLLGFGAYLFINLLFLRRVVPLCRRGEPVALMAVVFWTWYMTVAAFNVVLEGPFMGVPFWIFIGLMFRYSSPSDVDSL